MRISSLTKRITGLALSLVVSAYSAAGLRAQIVLRSQGDQQTRSLQDSSRKQQLPVSRDTNPMSRELQSRLGRGNDSSMSIPAARASGASARDSEYREILAEASFLERHYSLVRRVVKFVSPSIVHIEAIKRTDPGKGFASSKIEEAGAGVIVDIRGVPHVLTNRHVIHSAELNSIKLELNDGTLLRPVSVWTDPSTDVAVMRLAERDLTAARVGNSDIMEVGDFVLAVGSPFGLSHSVTYGILSAKGRRNLELGSREIEIQDFFQTDAAINPGNSGGPLLNLRGEVVGINTAIASNSGGNEGIGFTIPINMAILVAEQLVTRGELQRAYLGVRLENRFDSKTATQMGLASNQGALVKDIIPGSPAQRAGILVGDVILEFDSIRVLNDGHLVQSVGLTPAGRNVGVVVFRGGRTMRLNAVLDASPEQ